MEMKELSNILQQNGIVGAGGAGFRRWPRRHRNWPRDSDRTSCEIEKSGGTVSCVCGTVNPAEKAEKR